MGRAMQGLAAAVAAHLPFSMLPCNAPCNASHCAAHKAEATNAQATAAQRKACHSLGWPMNNAIGMAALHTVLLDLRRRRVARNPLRSGSTGVRAYGRKRSWFAPHTEEPHTGEFIRAGSENAMHRNPCCTRLHDSSTTPYGTGVMRFWRLPV